MLAGMRRGFATDTRRSTNMANRRMEAALCFAAVIGAAACSGPEAARQQAVDTAANTGSTAGTAGQQPAYGNIVEAEPSVLVGSSPVAGSTVTGPVDVLVLRFSPPARLDEVTVTGPDGTMPMMLSPVGEQDSYSVPLSGLTAGRYTVDWRQMSPE
jgi:hypothetical protein